MKVTFEIVNETESVEEIDDVTLRIHIFGPFWQRIVQTNQ